MAGDDHQAIMQRIEAALARLDRVDTPVVTAPDARLATRHQALREAVRDAMAQLDTVIEELAAERAADPAAPPHRRANAAR